LEVAISLALTSRCISEASYTGGDMRQEGNSPYCHLALGCAEWEVVPLEIDDMMKI
jgi:hypothetical protein